jgi:hypothetical protein
VKRLLIADCRLPIVASFAGGGFARCGRDGCEFIGFGEKRGQLLCGHDAGFGEQFDPQRGCVGFLLNGSDFGNEFCLAAGAATGPVVRCHRGSAAQNLLCNHATGIVAFRNRPRHLNDAQGKGFCSGFQFDRVHAPTLQPQSAIGNRQSEMQK